MKLVNLLMNTLDVPTEHGMPLMRDTCQQTYGTRMLESFAKVVEIPELLSLIFVHCLPTIKFSTPDPKKAPLILSHVCKHWRNVALNTPCLWTTLRMFSHGCSEETANRQIQVLNHWIRFSGRCHLSFQLAYYNDETADIFVDSILRTVLNHADRCRHIDIQVPPQCDYPFLKWLEKGSHVLEFFRISSLYIIRRIHEDISVTMDLSKFPNLRSFNVKSIRLQLAWIDVPTCLQTFSLECDKFSLKSCNSIAKTLKKFHLLLMESENQNIFEVMAKCFPELESIEYYTGMPSFVPQGRIEFPHLRRLMLSSEGLESSGLYNSLYLPSLSSLDVYLKLAYDTNWPHLAALLRDSSPPLKKVTINVEGLNEQSVIDILRTVPNLTSLIIYDAHMSGDTLIALTLPSVGDGNTGYRPIAEIEPLCPHLEELSLLQDPVYPKFPTNLALNMIASRRCRPSDDSGPEPRRPWSILNYCRIEVDDSDSLRSHPDIMKYLEDGLVLETEVEDIDFGESVEF
ncbi:hypothetical protein EW145_g6349 [Phellinidium pouzarii]|uniref:Uncharacterized protein n=1 Tax=Phellinidium pouzarii TaxID=167371 RepID=A0A4V3XBU5_9AGAM|nr:hypothetical protein EW145_g6349 [Phellinidium pouzarii]